MSGQVRQSISCTGFDIALKLFRVARAVYFTQVRSIEGRWSLVRLGSLRSMTFLIALP